MTCFHVARFGQASKGFNTLAPSRGGAYILEIYDDVLLPDHSELEVHGLVDEYRVNVADHYDPALGVYQFILENPVSGPGCRAVLRWGEGEHTLFEKVDLTAHIQASLYGGNTEPLRIDFPDRVIEHSINLEEDHEPERREVEVYLEEYQEECPPAETEQVYDSTEVFVTDPLREN